MLNFEYKYKKEVKAMDLLRIYTPEGEVVVKQISKPRSYEAMVILKPELSDEEVTETIKKYEEMISSLGGEIINIENWGKKKLAYEMDKKREGIYVIINFKLLPEHVETINRSMRLDGNVHRHMIVRINPKED